MDIGLLLNSRPVLTESLDKPSSPRNNNNNQQDINNTNYTAMASPRNNLKKVKVETNESYQLSPNIQSANNNNNNNNKIYNQQQQQQPIPLST
ncbi:hypothetical protein DFA_01332 [Cavenderia fasciculata]|uniref:Uncharacterized protein n=1 Tax=Cavenderia fasciculata TaxID=261658 RepID=F4PS65_CACFS|nr:uncharacterized protein DFA_01332 [Cavenderia fasciculata]EGG21448.1 hypothetical protein DFA_01332 [Cavenderia fasciculata]|eukprot:XP_004359298.1 hypothetical protein DFA_01332 [Cavenderia fasciculata]